MRLAVLPLAIWGVSVMSLSAVLALLALLSNFSYCFYILVAFPFHPFSLFSYYSCRVAGPWIRCDGGLLAPDKSRIWWSNKTNSPSVIEKHARKSRYTWKKKTGRMGWVCFQLSQVRFTKQLFQVKTETFRCVLGCVTMALGQTWKFNFLKAQELLGNRRKCSSSKTVLVDMYATGDGQ